MKEARSRELCSRAQQTRRMLLPALCRTVFLGGASVLLEVSALMWVGNECHQLLPCAVLGILHGLVGLKKVLNTNRLTNASLVNIAE